MRALEHVDTFSHHHKHLEIGQALISPLDVTFTRLSIVKLRQLYKLSAVLHLVKTFQFMVCTLYLLVPPS